MIKSSLLFDEAKCNEATFFEHDFDIASCNNQRDKTQCIAIDAEVVSTSH